MIIAKAFAGKHYAVYGLARSGLATVEALLASGARVTAWDENEGARTSLLRSSGEGDRDAQRRGGGADSVRPALAPPSSLRDATSPLLRNEEVLRIADLATLDLTQFDSLILSPGVPLNTHPLAARARAAKLEIIGDIELFARARPELPPHKVVGITGTNGKSTTTALVHHILQTAGMPSLMGGNIGLPILSQEPLPEGGVYVLELSSYQIDLTQSLDCDVAVLLNITPDHLDRYESFEGYAASKARLFELSSGSKFRGRVNLGPIARAPSLEGPHNAQNSAAAIDVCLALGLSLDRIEHGLITYPGLPHRMERIRKKDGVLFVNDSKATNATATAPALAAFPAIRWICGGRAKADHLDECAPNFGHVRTAYTIGEASDLFARILAPHMKVAECGDLAHAVLRAANDAQPGETVLLSPACASFDQFTDFEARGDAFRRLVGAL